MRNFRGTEEISRKFPRNERNCYRAVAQIITLDALRKTCGKNHRLYILRTRVRSIYNLCHGAYRLEIISAVGRNSGLAARD